MFRAATFATAIVLATFCSRLLAQEQIPWLSDLRQARQQAEQQQRLVLLHFWSESCPPCRALEQNVFNQPELIRVLANSVIPVKINVLQQPRYADFYKIDRVPTDIIVDPSGRELYRATSPQNMTGYIAMIDQVRAQSAVHTGRALEALAQDKLNQFKSALPPMPGGYNQEEPSETVNSSPTDLLSSNDSWQSASESKPKLPQASQKALVQNEYSPPAKPIQTPSQFAGANDANPRSSNPYFQASAKTPAEEEESTEELESDDPSPSASQQSRPGFAVSVPANPDALFNTKTAQTGNNRSTQMPPQSTPIGIQAQPGNGGPAPWTGAPNYNPSQLGSTAVPSGPAPNVGPIPGPAAGQDAGSIPNFAGQGPLSPAPGVPPAGQGPVPGPQNGPPLALDGYCPVSLVGMSKWVKGDSRFGAIHRGRTYFFSSPADQQRFLADPDRFSPALSGYDPVRFAETGQFVEGKREHGLFLTNSYYLFADEASLSRFESQPNGYVNVVRQAMTSGRPGTR